MATTEADMLFSERTSYISPKPVADSSKDHESRHFDTKQPSKAHQKQLKAAMQGWNIFKPPPRSPVGDHLRKVIEAIYAFVKVDSVGDKFLKAGFCISDDGFILTTSRTQQHPPEVTTSHSRRKVQLFDGINVECSYVQDFHSSGVSISLLKGDIGNDFLKPDDLFISNESMAIVSFGDEELANSTPVVTRGRVIDTGDSENASAILKMGTSNKVGTEIIMTGGPVLSMRPGYFAGVLSSVEANNIVRFCPVTVTSPVWLEIERAMNSYREIHTVRHSNKSGDDDFCCALL